MNQLFVTKHLSSLSHIELPFQSAYSKYILSLRTLNPWTPMQENYYLVLFMFARQLYFYVLGPISLLGY